MCSILPASESTGFWTAAANATLDVTGAWDFPTDTVGRKGAFQIVFKQEAPAQLKQFRDLKVTAEDGKLYAKPDRQRRDRLKYQGQRQFVPAENFEMRIRITPADGKAEAIEIETESEKLSAERVE